MPITPVKARYQDRGDYSQHTGWYTKRLWFGFSLGVFSIYMHLDRAEGFVEGDLLRIQAIVNQSHK
ncbi:MAG: hypothetical protein HC764_15590 [Pleurocapsa sp. CRU_1_2]|nr:hypothetical protein [Pleurocapsa sp. CRU_1_2]